MKIKKIFSIVVMVLGVIPCFSQNQRFTLDELIVKLIENNYQLKISGTRTRQAENNVNLSPFMPSVSVTARQNHNEVSQTTDTYGLGASVNWRLFDGLAMFAQHQKQKQTLDVQRLTELGDLEDLVRQINNQYYLIVSLNSRAKVARELVELSRTRYEEAKLKYSIEALSGLEMKLAKTDLNADSTYLMRQLEAVDAAYIGLNKMLNLGYSTYGYINDTIAIDKLIDYEKIEDTISEQNTQILLAGKGVEVAGLNVKLAKSSVYPTLDFSAGYNLSTVNVPPATSFANSSGANYGLTLGVKIFEGLEVQRNIKNTKLDREISSITEQSIRNEVMASFNNHFLNYTNNLRLIDFESENSEAMRLNLEVAMERYRLGELSGLDFRNIQQQYLSAVDRQINALYLAKMSEIALKSLAGLVVER